VTKASGGGLTVAVTGPLPNRPTTSPSAARVWGVLLAMIVLLWCSARSSPPSSRSSRRSSPWATAIGIIGLFEPRARHAVDSRSSTLLIGLGVGVDYALFIVTRHRQGLVAARRGVVIINAVNTSGRAVSSPGSSCASPCSACRPRSELPLRIGGGRRHRRAHPWVAPSPSCRRCGIHRAKVMSRNRKKYLTEGRHPGRGSDSKGFWPNWADRVQKYPGAVAGVALIIIVAIALPFFSLQLARPDQGTDPAGTPTRVASTCSPRGSGRASRAARAGDRGAAESRPRAGEGRGRRRQQPGVVQNSPPTTVYIPNKTGDGYVALTTVYRPRRPQDKATTDLVNHLGATRFQQAVGNAA